MKKVKRQPMHEVVLNRIQNHVMTCSEVTGSGDNVTPAQVRLAATIPIIMEDVAILFEAKLTRKQSLKVGKALEGICRELTDNGFKETLEILFCEIADEIMSATHEAA